MSTPATRQQLLNTIFETINKGTEETLVVDHRDSESSMTAERHAFNRFYNVVLPALKAKYPLLDPSHSDSSEEIARREEDKAIQSMVDEIQKRLAGSKKRIGHQPAPRQASSGFFSRLFGGRSTASNTAPSDLVGQREAERAVREANSRTLRNLVNRTGTYWDDVGRYHTALRALLCDNNLGGYYRTQYLNGQAGYNFRIRGTGRQEFYSYRRLLAYIWLGASESAEEMEYPIFVTESEATKEQLRDMSIEAVITEVAQNRREHNNDGPEYYTSAADHQTCGTGFRGRLFTMLKFNENYVKSKEGIHLESLIPHVRDIIFEEFDRFSLADKELILVYFEDRVINQMEPDEENTAAVNRLIARLNGVATDKLLQIIDTNASGHFTKFKANLRRLQANDREQLLLSISQLVTLEVDTLKGTADNPIHDPLLRKIAFKTITDKFNQSVREGSAEVIAEYRDIINRITKRLDALYAITDNECMRALMSPEYRQSQHFGRKKAALLQRINYYQGLVGNYHQQLQALLSARQESSQQQVAAEFMFASQMASSWPRFAELDAADVKMGEMNQQLEKLNEQLSQLEQYGIKHMHSDFRATALSHQQSGTLETPHFYAKYLWSVLLEKSSRHHFIIDEEEEHDYAKTDDVDRVLHLVFGNEERGINPKSTAFQRSFMFAFNKLRSAQRQSHKPRWDIVKERINHHYNVNLANSELAHQDKVYTMMESITDAASIPASYWQTIAEASGTVDLLESQQKIDEEDRQASNYGSRLMDAATRLDLVLKTNEMVDSESDVNTSANPLPVSEQTLANHQAWSQFASSLYQIAPVDQRTDLLVNFVTQTIFNNLGITEITREDQGVIEKIVKQYMGVRNYDNFPLAFDVNTNNTVEKRIAALGKHVAMMVTTLSPPSLKSSFEAGMLRLMSRNDATNAVGTTKYVLRLSNREPWKLVLTTCSLVNRRVSVNQFRRGSFSTRQKRQYNNDYLESLSNDNISTFSLDGTAYPFSSYPGTELQTIVAVKAPRRTEIVGDRTMSDMTSVEYQQERAQAYSGYGDYYTMNGPRRQQQFFQRQLSNESTESEQDAHASTRDTREREMGSLYMAFDS